MTSHTIFSQNCIYGIYGVIFTIYGNPWMYGRLSLVRPWTGSISTVESAHRDGLKKATHRLRSTLTTSTSLSSVEESTKLGEFAESVTWRLRERSVGCIGDPGGDRTWLMAVSFDALSVAWPAWLSKSLQLSSRRSWCSGELCGPQSSTPMEALDLADPCVRLPTSVKSISRCNTELTLACNKKKNYMMESFLYNLSFLLTKQSIQEALHISTLFHNLTLM